MKPKILIGCEFSGRVRDSFTALGYEAWSCDLVASETPGNHLRGNVLDFLRDGWDLAIFHPPCDHTAVSGARWFNEKIELQNAALKFIARLYNAPIPHIALEQPVSITGRVLGPPTQIIQPWHYGDLFVKTTCLWLRNLPPLMPTHERGTKILNKRFIHHAPPGPARKRARSRTFPGVAQANGSAVGKVGSYSLVSRCRKQRLYGGALWQCCKRSQRTHRDPLGSASFAT